jgi:hypothetical protein
MDSSLALGMTEKTLGITAKKAFAITKDKCRTVPQTLRIHVKLH